MRRNEGNALAASRFTYAVGRLALVVLGSDCNQPRDALALVDRIAIANPALAPYGSAAVQVLKALEIYEALQPKLVMGENVGQAYTLFATGNAQAAFVALSQIRDDEPHCTIAPRLHAPIRQDAVQLSSNEAATAFVRFLKSESAKDIIEADGYGG